MVQRHQEQLFQKDQVFHLTRRMLQVARSKGASSSEQDGDNSHHEDNHRKRARVEVKTEDDRQVEEDREVGSSEPAAVVSSAEAREEGMDQGENVRDESPAKNPVQENLLALSYAMFDTLFGTESFDPRNFCNFLIRTGERQLAEEIALAALEKSGGAPKTVEYLLHELVVQSKDPELLVKRTKEYVLGLYHCEGKGVLSKWQESQGDSYGAFETAVSLPDVVDCLRAAIPLATTVERREKLKQSCKGLINPAIAPYKDEEWPGFVMHALDMEPPEKTGYGDNYFTWMPSLKVNFGFAASIGHERGREVIAKSLETALYKHFTAVSSNLDLGPSSTSDPRQSVLGKKTDRQKELADALNSVETKVLAKGELMQILQDYHVDPLQHLAKIIGDQLGIGMLVRNDCPTVRHRDFKAAFKCTKCRAAFYTSASKLGYLLAIRKHITTRDSPFFAAIGLDFPNAAELVPSLAETFHLHPEAVSILLESPAERELFCRGN
jgi:hypothetical protein